VESDPQPWPRRLGRDQRSAAKRREKDFQAALKAAGRRRGWRYAGGWLFRQDGEWFASILPSLLWERGAAIAFALKPMALDPLFWDIVGLPDNGKLPLSFRANGAWVLHPPPRESRVGSDVAEVSALAELAARSADGQLEESRETRSTGRMLDELTDGGPPRGRRRALAICLNLLDDDLDGALALCRESGRSNDRDSGGFTTSNPDGSVSTFVDQAEAWIVAKRRSALRLV